MWLQKKFSKMKAEKEPEEFEFGCEDLTKDWLDEISDLEEQEEKSEAYLYVPFRKVSAMKMIFLIMSRTV